MDTKAKIAEWAKLMGFQGKIPENFYSICNASTTPIWAQIIANVKPRQENEHIRQNIIIQVLRQAENKTKSNSGIDFSQQLHAEEVQVWREKCRLAKVLSKTQQTVKANAKELESISHRNRALYIKIENLEQRIEELEGKDYLYRKKREQVKKEYSAAEEKLCNWIRHTAGDNCSKDTKNIADDLNNSAGILKVHVSASACDKLPVNYSILRGYSMLATPGLAVMNTPRKFDFSVCSNAASNDSMFEVKLDTIRGHVPVDSVRKILQTYNQQAVWTTLRGIQENLEADLKTILVDYEEKSFHITDDEMKSYLSKLYAMNIEKQLKAMMCIQKAKVLQRKILEREIQINESLESGNYSEAKLVEIKSAILSNKEHVASNAKIASLLSGLEELQAMRANMSESEECERESMQLQESVVSAIKNLLYKLNLFSCTKKLIHRKKDEMLNLTRELNFFLEDFTWLSPLTKGSVTGEVEAFTDFCLDYNRIFTYTSVGAESMFLRDFSTHSLPYVDDLDSSTASMLALILQSPSSFPEAILLNIIRKKKKLEALTLLEDLTPPVKSTKYTLEELRSRDSSLHSGTEKLLRVLQKTNDGQLKISLSRVQKMVQFWAEMPIKDHLLPTQLAEGHNYKHWEALYDSHYAKL